MENHGRALRIEHEHETLSAGWAGRRKWKIIGPQCSEFVRKQLEPLVKQIRATKAQLGRRINPTKLENRESKTKNKQTITPRLTTLTEASSIG